MVHSCGQVRPSAASCVSVSLLKHYVCTVSAQYVPLAPGDGWNCKVGWCCYLVSETNHQVKREKYVRDSGVITCWFKVAQHHGRELFSVQITRLIRTIEMSFP